MRIKTSELTGAALDYAVAEAQDCLLLWWQDNVYSPSTNWAEGGPIIERGGLTLTHQGTRWGAQTDDDLVEYGPTPLIAAMRCYVASKLGDAVDIPRALRKD